MKVGDLKKLIEEKKLSDDADVLLVRAVAFEKDQLEDMGMFLDVAQVVETAHNKQALGILISGRAMSAVKLKLPPPPERDLNYCGIPGKLPSQYTAEEVKAQTDKAQTMFDMMIGSVYKEAVWEDLIRLKAHPLAVR